MSAVHASGAASRGPEEDPSWQSYARTILEVHTTPRFQIDLAQPITRRARAALFRGGLSGSFGLVTPENPRGQRSDPARNAERWAAFRRALPPDTLEVDGRDPDSTHRERGVALPWPRADVLALAHLWEQSAIYWFDGDAMWVIGATTDAAPWRLGGGHEHQA